MYVKCDPACERDGRTYNPRPIAWLVLVRKRKTGRDDSINKNHQEIYNDASREPAFATTEYPYVCVCVLPFSCICDWNFVTYTFDC